MKIYILGLFVGLPRLISAQNPDRGSEEPWESGIFKEPAQGPVWLSHGGLRGDGQADRKRHGGPDKALCVFPAAHYEYWRAQPQLTSISFGGFGENVTLGGATETQLCVGDRFELGEAVVEVSQPRQPCWKLARRWQVRDLKEQMEQSGFTGFYFRVIRHGYVKVGDAGVLLERPWPEWTLAECNAIMHQRTTDRAAALALSQCQHLSGAWKDSLFARTQSLSAPQS